MNVCVPHSTSESQLRLLYLRGTTVVVELFWSLSCVSSVIKIVPKIGFKKGKKWMFFQFFLFSFRAYWYILLVYFHWYIFHWYIFHISYFIDTYIIDTYYWHISFRAYWYILLAYWYILLACKLQYLMDTCWFIWIL